MSLQLFNINFSFSGRSPVLDDVSLSLAATGVYALMGANGSGKTTLFNLITGFLRLKKGKILFGEKEITGFSPYRVNREGIGRTFQDLRLVSKITVKENVVLAMRNNPTDNWTKALLPKSVYRKELKQLQTHAESIIKEYFLHDVQDSLAGEISYGQQKLLNLACCVANGASLLLLDEPVAGIQPEYRLKVASLIKQMKAKGKTVLLIEHNTDFIAEVADQVLFLHEGKITSYENIELLRADKVVMEAYL